MYLLHVCYNVYICTILTVKYIYEFRQTQLSNGYDFISRISTYLHIRAYLICVRLFFFLENLTFRIVVTNTYFYNRRIFYF